MKRRKHVIPLGAFCAAFLIAVLYFVIAVQNPADTDIYGEKARTFKVLTEVLPDTELIALENKSKVKNFFSKISPISKSEKEAAKQERNMFVNFNFLNLRREAISTSALVGKLNRNDKLEILEFTNVNWAHVRVAESTSVAPGTDGYVAKRYLAAAEIAAPYSYVVDIPNLVYFHISNERGTASPDQVLAVKNFQVQLDYMVENSVETLTYTDLQLIKNGDREVPSNAVMLTFDGAYADHYAVFKLLKSNNLKGNFMIPTEEVGEEGKLTWHQIREMHEGGMEIGSMGQRTMYYGNLSNETVDTEIAISKATLEGQLKARVSAFAYPMGSYVQRAEGMLSEAGYKFARTTIPATQFDLANQFKLPGLRVYPAAATNQLKLWGIGF